MPEAMPQIMMTVRCSVDSGAKCASLADSHAASWIIGPSRPIDAPLPTESSAETLRTQVVRSFRSTVRVRAASR